MPTRAGVGGPCVVAALRDGATRQRHVTRRESSRASASWNDLLSAALARRMPRGPNPSGRDLVVLGNRTVLV